MTSYLILRWLTRRATIDSLEELNRFLRWKFRKSTFNWLDRPAPENPVYLKPSIQSPSVECPPVHVPEVQKKASHKRGFLSLKIDEICELVKNDISNVYNSKTVEDAVNKAANLFAIPRFHVLPVKNYETESELLTSFNILALTALRKSLMFADDFLQNQYET